MYYTGENLLNADAPFNFSIGNRSAGKSFNWKRYCVKNAIYKKLDNGMYEEFIYLRRTEQDLLDCLPKFYEDIAQKFPNYFVECKGRIFYLEKYDNTGAVIFKRPIGYALAMSTLSKIKSISFENVTTIFYDEFLPDDLRYLHPNDPSFEPNCLLSLYFTVARGYNKPIRENVKLIGAANAVTFYNPYFSMFNIDLTNKNKTIVNNVYAERFVNDYVNEEIRKTKFGKILESTSYGDYALNNKSMHDTPTKIGKHLETSKISFSLYLYQWFTCWYDYDCNLIFFSDSFDKTHKEKYKLQNNVPEYEDVSIPWFKGDVVKWIRKFAELDRIYYESPKIQAALAGLFIPKPLK